MSTRVQFGNKLQEYGVVQEKLARMAMAQYVTEVMWRDNHLVIEHLCGCVLVLVS